MALLINNKCINCNMCDPECPNQAITLGKGTNYTTKEDNSINCKLKYVT